MAGIEERISKLEKILNRALCCDNSVFTGPQGNPGEDGIDGVQGPQGPQGVPGPVGPTGLNWQGTFVPCVVYSENDAVSFDGSSYFVTCETTDGSECETPYDNTSCWGLLANQGAVGPMGPQGVQGLTGATGAKGLTWRGTWVSSISYLIDDAVSFNGTSYICISNSTLITNPAITPLKWSVLAAKGSTGATGSTGAPGIQGIQGLQGIQGIQGIQGLQGVPGPAADSGSFGFTISSISFPYTVLPYTVNYVTNNFGPSLRRVTLDVSSPIGTRISVSNAGAYNFAVTGNVLGGQIYYNGADGSSLTEVVILPSQEYVFTNVDQTGSWLCEYVSSKLEYGSFVARVTTGLTSTVQVIKNTLNTTVSLTTDGTDLKILLGDSIMTNTNTYISASNYLAGPAFYMFYPERTAANTMYLRGRNLAGLQALGFGGEVYVELRVYN
jgi:hypothetical protein